MPTRSPMQHPLFESYALQGLPLANRFVMAPMTRSRTTQPGDVPNALMAEYYAQRASAGLIITEATQVSLQGKGYAKTPGIYTEQQVAGWKLVSDAVHQAGSKIFLQLWHVGRVSSAQVNGLQPVAPSEIPAKETKVYIFDGAPKGDATMIPTDDPRAMTQEDIDQTIVAFRQGAANAIAAGMDGVEIHGANGYLIDQFLRSNANQRTDAYGGDPHNRIRFLMEVTQAVVAEIGAEHTGVRLSPFITYKDMADSDILDTIMLAAKELNDLGIAYIHLCEADWDDAPQVPESFRQQLRSVFKQAIIVTGNYTPDLAAQVLSRGYADLVGFGRKFLTNPDYPARVAADAPLNDISDTHTLFGGGGARGYTDYTTMESSD